MMNLVNFKFLGKKMAMSITKKHNASFSSSILSSLSTPTFPKQPILPKNDSSSILSSLSTPTFPKQPILPKNDFNSIVVSRSLSEDPSRAVNFFIEKKLKGFKFDMRIYPSLIYACVRVNSIGTLSAVLADYVKKGLNLHVDSEELSLTSKVLRGEKVERSRLAVAATAGKHLLTINNLMRAFNIVKHEELVLALFNSVILRGLTPDESTLDELISSTCCSGMSALSPARSVHAMVLKLTFFNPTIKLSNSLIRMYFICGDVDSATSIFHSLRDKNLGSWNRYLTGLAHSGMVVECVKALDLMLDANFKPNPATFLAIFTACCHSGAVDLGMRFYKRMSKYDVTPTLKHNGVIIDMLSRAGQFDMALDFIAKMGFAANDIIWGSLFSGAKLHNNHEIGLLAFGKLTPRGKALHELELKKFY